MKKKENVFGVNDSCLVLEGIRKAICANKPLAEICSLFLHAIEERYTPSVARLYRYDSNIQNFVLQASFYDPMVHSVALYEEHFDPVISMAEHPFWKEVVSGDKAFYARENEMEHALPQQCVSVISRYGFKEFVVLPVKFNKEPNGLIVLYFLSGHTSNMSESDESYLEVLGDFYTLAVAMQRLSSVRMLVKSKVSSEDVMRKLSKQLAEQDDAHTLQTDYLSIITHELRNLLAIINSSNDVITRKLLTLEEIMPKGSTQVISKRCQKISSAIRRSTELIDKTLALAKVESNKLEPMISQVDFQLLIHETIQQYEDIFKKGELSVQISELPTCYPADAWLMSQVFNNLISNAIKYSTENIYLKIEGKVFETHIEIIISDHGVGMKKEQLDHIFEKFYRARKDSNSHGTGLGLYLVKSFINLHQGSISVQSVPNQGTSFTIKLPLISKS